MKIKKILIIFFLTACFSLFAGEENSVNHDQMNDERNATSETTFKDILRKINSKRRRISPPQHNEYDNGENFYFSDNRNKVTRRQSKLKNRLTLTHSDIIIEENDKYFDLYVKEKIGIKSILLTTVSNNFTTSPTWNYEYALRSFKYIKENKNPRLLYRGKLIGFKENLFFLITSEAITHEKFGKVFKIRIPLYVTFGYKWENFGTLLIKQGLKINIRTFARKHADYTDGFADNVITVDKNSYSGKDNIYPEITLLDIVETGDKLTAYVKYTDNEKYFKSFYIKEGNDEFKKIAFSRIDNFRDMRSVLIESVYDIIEKKIVIFKVYFYKKNDPRVITITGEDISGNKCKTPVAIKIPKISNVESSSN